jgi:hypothetical protein
MTLARRLATRLLRPALAGLGLLLLAVSPSTAAANQDHEGHCATVSQATALPEAAQPFVRLTVGVPHEPCDQCPDGSCRGQAHCAAGGVVAVASATIAAPVALPSDGMQPSLSGRVPPSFDPTPPTPPPNTSSVR